MHKDVIHRPDGVREAVQSSDIAHGWDPACRSKQSTGAPVDADFGTVMILGKDGLKLNPKQAVQQVCKDIAAAKESKTTIKLGSICICE